MATLSVGLVIVFLGLPLLLLADTPTSGGGGGGGGCGSPNDSDCDGYLDHVGCQGGSSCAPPSRGGSGSGIMDQDLDPHDPNIGSCNVECG